MFAGCTVFSFNFMGKNSWLLGKIWCLLCLPTINHKPNKEALFNGNIGKCFFICLRPIDLLEKIAYTDCVKTYEMICKCMEFDFYHHLYNISCALKSLTGGLSMETLRILHAGSMQFFLQEMINSYGKKYPAVQIFTEGCGARKGARKIRNGENWDLFISADDQLTRDLLMPEYTRSNILFASTQLVLSYTPKSRYRQEITGDNWYEILLRKDVRYGHTDPELDPGGYRALLCWQLAEKHYRQPGLSLQLMKKFCREDQLSDGRRIQEKMQAGTLDYFFGYKTSAKRRGNLYLELPPEINFSVPKQAAFYQQAEVALAGKDPGEKMIVRGAPIRYSISLLKASEKKETARHFLRFLLQRRKEALVAAGFSSLKLSCDAGSDMAVGADFWQDMINREGAE